MKLCRLNSLARGCFAAATCACAWLAAIGAARAADGLPRPAYRQTIEMVSASSLGEVATPGGPRLSPADPNPIPAVDCVNHCPPGYQATWKALGPGTDFQEWAQGEYVGRARLPHVPVYRLRVDDSLQFAFRVDRDRIAGQYKINVGDELSIESSADPSMNRTLVVLPDGTVTLPLVGSVPASGSTFAELRERINEALKKYQNNPAIVISPLKVNSKLEDLRAAIVGRTGFKAQQLPGRITPEGTIQLPAIGSVPAQGLTLDEFQTELNERYAEQIEGMEIIPSLKEHAPRIVYVLGEVNLPGRYVLDAPTTVMQAISMAGSWTVGAQITHVVVFRRGDDWRLLATALDIRAALLGKTPCPDGEIWVSDSDLVIVPKSKLLRADNFIDLVFTRGVYGVLPVGYSVSYQLFKNAIPPFLIVP
jgi:polysaccharide biosynthesis/export protein